MKSDLMALHSIYGIANFTTNISNMIIVYKSTELNTLKDEKHVQLCLYEQHKLDEN